MIDRSMVGAEKFSCFQFERNGYFSVDPDSSSSKVRRISICCNVSIEIILCVNHLIISGQVFETGLVSLYVCVLIEVALSKPYYVSTFDL